MTYTSEWNVSRGSDKRSFVVHYFDEPRERVDAISFFEDNDCGVYRLCPVTEELWRMPIAEANEFLASHPTHQQIESLYIRSRICTITDSDLTHLQHIPELRHLHILSQAVTDDGIANIKYLTHLERLVVYSPLVTDGCLDWVRILTHLRSLDLQGSPGIARANTLADALPRLTEFWPPHP